MIGVGLAPMLALMNSHFPDADPSQIQLVSTLPNLIVVPTALIVAKISKRISHKYLAASGSFLACLFAVLGCAYHDSLSILYVWACLLGVAAGITCNVGTYIIDDWFTPEKKIAVLGYQALAGSIGAMTMTLIGGQLVVKSWYFGYLAYLIMIPAFIFSLTLMPCRIQKSKPVSDKEKKDIPTRWTAILILFMISFMFGMVYNTYNANLAMVVAENGYGTAKMAGNVLSVIMMASGLTGLIVGRVSQKLQNYTITFALTLLTIGYMLIFIWNCLFSVVLGGLISGISISFIMPNIVYTTSKFGGNRAKLAMTLGTVGSQIGTLISPEISVISHTIFGSANTKYRFLLAALLSAAITCFSLISNRLYFDKLKK